MKSSRPRVQSLSKGIIIMSLSNHIIWSSHHVLSRYLQIQAKMDGMIILCTGKLAAMVMTYFWGDYVSSWCKVNSSSSSLEEDDDPSKTLAVVGGTKTLSFRHTSFHTFPNKLDTACYSTPLVVLSLAKENDEQTSRQSKEERKDDDEVESLKEISKNLDTTNTTTTTIALSETAVYWTKTNILILNALLTTTRASLNVVSAKYATSYNLSLINSSVIFLVPLADRFFFKTTLPKSMWHAVFWSFVGSAFIACSHIPRYMDGGEEDEVLSSESTTTTSIQENSYELYGCYLQMISCIFIVAMRLLIRMTEGIIKPTELVQSANIGTFLLPAIYTTFINPSSWDYRPFFNMTTLTIWFLLSFLIFFFAATCQVALVQSMGPGLYSSFTAIRIVGAVVLSSFLLNESIRNSLEGVGLAINIITMTIYLVYLYKEEWGGVVDDKNKRKIIENENKEIQIPDVEVNDSINDTASIKDKDQESETASAVKSEYQRLIKRK